MPQPAQFYIRPDMQPAARQLGIDGPTIAEHPAITWWRALPERSNGLLQATLAEGDKIRWHVKLYQPCRGPCPATVEADAIRLLQRSGIPTVPLIAYGVAADGRGCLITDDLRGFSAADKLLQSGFPAQRLVPRLAALAAQLHNAGLHHRDLYLCHFFVLPVALDKGDEPPMDIRLIDAGRVRRLPRWPWTRRWIVKDLSQFWYSAGKIGLTTAQRAQWLDEYLRRRGLPGAARLQKALERKAASIERHDRSLRRRQPGRNISLPQDR